MRMSLPDQEWKSQTWKRTEVWSRLDEVQEQVEQIHTERSQNGSYLCGRVGWGATGKAQNDLEWWKCSLSWSRWWLHRCIQYKIPTAYLFSPFPGAQAWCMRIFLEKKDWILYKYWESAVVKHKASGNRETRSESMPTTSWPQDLRKAAWLPSASVSTLIKWEWWRYLTCLVNIREKT